MLNRYMNSNRAGFSIVAALVVAALFATSVPVFAAMGAPPETPDEGVLAMAIVYVKDWDKLREYEQRIAPIIKKYNVRFLSQAIVHSVTDPMMEKPDRFDVFHFEDQASMRKLFQDPELIEAVKWRDQHATSKVIFVMGTSTSMVR